MKRLIFVPLALVILLLFAWPAAAQHAADSRQAKFDISAPIAIGGKTIEPGTYIVQHRTLENGTFLIFETPGTRDEVARVACEAANIPEKAKFAELRTRRQPNGTLTLMEVRFAGETRAHVVAGP